jgi:uncharacterized membrane protein
MKLLTLTSILLPTTYFSTEAWTPVPRVLNSGSVAARSPSIFASISNNNEKEDITDQFVDFPQSNDDKKDILNNLAAPLTVASIVSMTPFPAAAAGDQIPSALAAYGHYLSLFAIVGLVTYERVTVEAGISKEKETSLAIADALVGLSGISVLLSGYYRATQYGKGWEFYSHEPFFWLKMVFLCIFGAASLFPTTTFIKRSVAIQTGKELEPMSEKLATRLQKVLNAELVMVASIPLAATLMVRFDVFSFGILIG